MSININRCENEINRVKTNIDNCFIACNTKGSTYIESARNSYELLDKIMAIPLSTSGMGTGNITTFSSPFIFIQNIELDWSIQAEYDFSNIGTSWNGFYCWSLHKQGWFGIHKLTDTHCVISHLCILSANGEEISGTWIESCGAYRFRYQIVGTHIIFTFDPYQGSYMSGTQIPFDGYISPVNMFSQVTASIDGQTNNDMLDIICIY